MSLCTHTVVMVEVSANITTWTSVVCSGQTRCCNINEQLDITFCLSSYVHCLCDIYIYRVYLPMFCSL